MVRTLTQAKIRLVWCFIVHFRKMVVDLDIQSIFRSHHNQCVTCRISVIQYGNTALHEAAKYNHADIVELLLQHKANASIRNLVISARWMKRLDKALVAVFDRPT